jgi:DNA-binding MarR family transcriptional regulator
MNKEAGVNVTIPKVGEGKRGEGGHIGYLLRQAQVAHANAMEKSLAECGVTLPQFTVMTMLAAYPGASGAELAQLSLLTPPTISLILGNLQRLGWISRQRHAYHRRIMHISLTAEGRRALAQSKAAVASWESLLLEGVPPREEKAVRHWLVRVASRALQPSRAEA